MVTIVSTFRHTNTFSGTMAVLVAPTLFFPSSSNRCLNRHSPCCFAHAFSMFKKRGRLFCGNGGLHNWSGWRLWRWCVRPCCLRALKRWDFLKRSQTASAAPPTENDRF
jgi:hypothetical protein